MKDTRMANANYNFDAVFDLTEGLVRIINVKLAKPKS